jgi:hypothetical protein
MISSHQHMVARLCMAPLLHLGKLPSATNSSSCWRDSSTAASSCILATTNSWSCWNSYMWSLTLQLLANCSCKPFMLVDNPWVAPAPRHAGEPDQPLQWQRSRDCNGSGRINSISSHLAQPQSDACKHFPETKQTQQQTLLELEFSNYLQQAPKHLGIPSSEAQWRILNQS